MEKNIQKLSEADVLAFTYLLEILWGHSKMTSSVNGVRGTPNYLQKMTMEGSVRKKG